MGLVEKNERRSQKASASSNLRPEAHLPVRQPPTDHPALMIFKKLSSTACQKIAQGGGVAPAKGQRNKGKRRALAVLCFKRRIIVVKAHCHQSSLSLKSRVWRCVKALTRARCHELFVQHQALHPPRPAGSAVATGNHFSTTTTTSLHAGS